MKKTLAILLVAFIGQLAYAQPKGMPTPPNCVHLHDNLFIDETEVANVHWLEYMHYIQRDYPAQVYFSTFPDTSEIVHADTLLFYFSNYRYGHAPVVGLSYQQVINYSQWRSAAASANYYRKNKSEDEELPDSVWLFRYRLPTVEEWEMAATGLHTMDSAQHQTPFPFVKPPRPSKKNYRTTDQQLSYRIYKRNMKAIKNDKVFPRVNAQIPNVSSLPDSIYYHLLPEYIGEVPVYIYEFPPNALGLYGMFGNVAEMTHQQRVAKGGHYRLPLRESTIKSTQYYEHPEGWLGFRNVCEVVRIPNPEKR